MTNESGGVTQEASVSQPPDGGEKRHPIRDVLDKFKGGKEKLAGFLQRRKSEKPAQTREAIAQIASLSPEQLDTKDLEPPPTEKTENPARERSDDSHTLQGAEDTVNIPLADDTQERLDDVRQELQTISEDIDPQPNETSTSEISVDEEKLDQVIQNISSYISILPTHINGGRLPHLLSNIHENMSILEQAMKDPNLIGKTTFWINQLASSSNSLESNGENIVHEFLRKNISTIDAQLRSSELPIRTKEACIEALVHFGSSPYMEDQDLALDIIHKHMDVIDQDFAQNWEEVSNIYGHVLNLEQQLKDAYDYEEREQPPQEYSTLQRLEKLIFKETPTNADLFLSQQVAIALVNQGEGAKNAAATITNDFLRFKYKMDYPDIVKTWVDSPNPIEELSKNLNTIADLEKNEKGSAKLLYENFNIRHFWRYPTEVLIRQCKEYDKNDKPYGMVLVGEPNKNGPVDFNDGFLEDFTKQLDGKYYLRIFEIQGKFDTAKVFLQTKKQYGDRKISFVYAAMHGGENVMAGSERHRGGRLRSSEIGGDIPIMISDRLDNNAKVILRSCSVGAELGIASKICDTLNYNENKNISVFGPAVTNKGNPQVDVIHSENGIDFAVEYNHNPADLRVYRSRYKDLTQAA